MFSPPESDDVLNSLGDKFLTAAEEAGSGDGGSG